MSEKLPSKFEDKQTNSFWLSKGTEKIIQTVTFTDRKKFDISFYLKTLDMIASTFRFRYLHVSNVHETRKVHVLLSETHVY